MGSYNQNDRSRSEQPGKSGHMEPDLGLLEIIQVLMQYKFLVIGVALSIVTASTIYAFTATPIYRAEITLAPVRGGGGMGSIGGLISQFGGALGGIASMAGMASGASKRSLGRGEASIALTSTSHIQGFIAENNLLPILFESIWDPEKEGWLVDSDEDIPTLSDGYDLFVRSILRQKEDPSTSIVVLSIEWKDPELAADWANNLVGSLNSSLREKTLRDTDKTIDFLNQELERTKVVELRQSIFFMIEQQIGSKTSARVQEEYAFKIINPAIAPDVDKYVRPERLFIIALGAAGGVVAGLFSAFFTFAISRLRKEYGLSRKHS